MLYVDVRLGRLAWLDLWLNEDRLIIIITRCLSAKCFVNVEVETLLVALVAPPSARSVLSAVRCTLNFLSVNIATVWTDEANTAARLSFRTKTEHLSGLRQCDMYHVPLLEV